jgi:uncharacterized protein (DUF2164 family)
MGTLRVPELSIFFKCILNTSNIFYVIYNFPNNILCTRWTEPVFIIFFKKEYSFLKKLKNIYYYIIIIMVFDKERKINLIYDRYGKYYYNAGIHNVKYFLDKERKIFLKSYNLSYIGSDNNRYNYDSRNKKYYLFLVNEGIYLDYDNNKLYYDKKNKEFKNIEENIKPIKKEKERCDFIYNNYKNSCNRLKYEINLDLEKSLNTLESIYSVFYNQNFKNSIKKMSLKEIKEYRISLKYYQFLSYECFRGRRIHRKICYNNKKEKEHERTIKIFKKIYDEYKKILEIMKNRLREIIKEANEELNDIEEFDD